MLSLEKINKLLFLLGMFFIPFNSFEGLEVLGEFRNESAAYFFLIGFALYLVTVLVHRKVSIPYKNPLLQLLVVFVLWCFLATLFNIHSVVDNYFKQTGGINRFVRQYASLIISTLLFLLFYWHVLERMRVKQILLHIRRVFLFSLVVASVYGVLETLIVVFNRGGFEPVLNVFNYFPFLEVELHEDRISSISYEPPFLAIFLITIAGWMFSYILTEKSIWRFVPTLLVLGLGFFSGSRTALIVLAVQLLVFAVVLLLDNRFRKYLLIFFGGFFLLLIIIVSINSEKVIDSVEEKLESLDFKSNLTENVSNKSRLGIQLASLKVAKRHPVTGVGFGQQAYHSRYEYPFWSTRDNYEFKLMYQNQNLKAFPPGYNLYVRILTETGLIGLFIFLFLILCIFYASYRLFKNSDKEIKVLGAILLISYTGMSINFLQIDTFRLYGFWINLAIIMKLMSEISKRKVMAEEIELPRKELE